MEEEFGMIVGTYKDLSCEWAKNVCVSIIILKHENILQNKL